MANDKLIHAKQQLAESRAAAGVGTGTDAASSDRLPPGQTLVTDHWPVLDLGLRPDIPREAWELKVYGQAEPAILRWDDFSALPQVELTTDFHCVTRWSIFDACVQGVLWREFMRHVKPHESATHVMFHSHDGYSTNLPLAELDQPNVAIVHSFNGKPLERDHGGPARMWVPHLYAWKSAKWVSGIEFMAGDRRGFWEVRGYHNHGDPWREQRFS